MLQNFLFQAQKMIFLSLQQYSVLRRGLHSEMGFLSDINLQTISELLGHTSIVLTAKTYARSDEGSKIRAVL